MSIIYAQEQSLPVSDYVAVLATTYMRDSRPIGNAERIGRILAGSNMIVTARDEAGAIVGLGRGISDGEWVVYLADLVVHADHQRKGIGSGILKKMKEIIGPGMGIVLVAYPEAEAYYKKIGLGSMPAFYVDREVRT
jgi:GNAT superfamily N-acetyltransferase